MLSLQDPLSRLHSHRTSRQGHIYQPPHATQIDQSLLDDARRRASASASVRRQNQAPGPTPLWRVWSADEDMTDEAPRLQTSPCPPSRVNAGEGRSLLERTSFKNPPPTGPKADRDDDYRGRPSIFLDASVVAAKTADIPSPTPTPGLGRNDVDMEEYVSPPAVSPPTASWPTTIQTQRQPTNIGVKSENKPGHLNFSFGKITKASLNPMSLTAFQPLASAVWKTPTAASFVKPSRAPLPLSTTSTSVSTAVSTSMAAWSPPDVQMTTPAPTSHPRFNFPTSASQHQQKTSQSRCTTPSKAMAPPHTMSPPRLQHLHIAPIAALNFTPPLPSPPLTAASLTPQLSTSIYLACLVKQEGNTGRDVKVMLKCKMMSCLQREGVTFGRESLGNGTVDRYRKGFGCGGCGEMLEVVVC